MRFSTLRLTWFASMLAAACSSSGAGDDAAIDATASVFDAPLDAPGTTAPGFRRCAGRPFIAPAPAGFATTAGGIVAATGSPLHASEDTIAPPGSTPHLIARFLYGPLNSGLDDEPVAVAIDDCTGWQPLGTHVTSEDALLDVPVALPLGPGVYEARYTVLGDASTTAGYLWILPAGTHVAVTDIDGTLTTSDTELFLQILNGSYVPQAYPSAKELTTAHAALGHVVVYVTGRPAYLTAKTRAWLAELGFAPGPLRLAPSAAEAVPLDSGVGTYKRDWLRGLVANGLTIDLAYGNATTDIFAYSGAGVSVGAQWIIGPNAGASGTHAVMTSWTERVADVEAMPPIVQPFHF